MMCPRCDELQERIVQLQEQLGVSLPRERGIRLRSSLKISPCSATILNRLYAAKGRVVSPWLLLDATAKPGANDDERDINNIRVRIVSMRKILGRDAIETVWGEGYRLSEGGMARVGQIIGDLSA